MNGNHLPSISCSMLPAEHRRTSYVRPEARAPCPLVQWLARSLTEPARAFESDQAASRPLLGPPLLLSGDREA